MTATRETRSDKVKLIFLHFDANKDGGLNRSEMAALVVAVNPRVKFSDEQINAILDEVFRTYAEFIDGDGRGLTFQGLLRTYEDGAGDADRDLDALGLDLASSSSSAAAAAVDTDIAGERRLDSQKNQRTAACAASPNDGVMVDDTWRLVDDLGILIKRLKMKQQHGDGKKNDNSDAYSDASWSREFGPSSYHVEVVWSETGPDYAAFVMELGVLRSRVDGSRSSEEAFDGHMAIGKVLYEHQLFKEALVSFERASELQPVDVKPHFGAGSSLYAIGKYEEAEEGFQLALEAADTRGNQWAYLLPQIHVNLGAALEGQGMLLSACEHYREAAILQPSHYRALKLLGSALLGVGENRAAVKALEEAISIKPDFADTHCDLASALHALGDDEKAIVEFQKAIDLQPGHVDALYNLAGLNMGIGRYQRASEMYTRVLTLCPNHWRAQLNKAVSLLGAGETDEARKAMKEALKMTKRIEVHDAIAHLKQLQRKKSNGGSNGDNGFFVAEAWRFKTFYEKTTPRQELADAIEIRAFQTLTRLCRCDVELLRAEMNDNNAPLSFSGTGAPEKTMRRNSLEKVLHRLLSFLKSETFQESVKAINERILSVLDDSGFGRVDIGMFYAIIAPICGGPHERRKRVAFEALLWRSVAEGVSQLKKVDAARYIKLLRSIYIPSRGVSEMMEIQGETDTSTVSLNEFLVMFDDPNWGFGVMSTLLRLELGDRKRHGRHVCAVCRYPIIGSRFREIKTHFSLCGRCYSDGKVPSAARTEEYTFKEYESESQALKDKFACFSS